MTPTEHSPEGDDTKIVEVYSAANEIDAGAVRAALSEAGIHAELVGNLAGGAFDVPLGISAPKLWVREEDAPAARQIIEQLQDRAGSDQNDQDAAYESFGEPDGDDAVE